MLHQVQLGRGPFKRGDTLIEVITAVAIIVTVIAIVAGGYKTRINKAKFEQTVNEMMSLAQASLDFYKSQGNWPMTAGDLVPRYMYANVTSSPFGGNYQVNSLNNAVTISTSIPLGLAQNYQGTLLEIFPGPLNDTILITQRLPNEFSGRLEYERRYSNRDFEETSHL